MALAGDLCSLLVVANGTIVSRHALPRRPGVVRFAGAAIVRYRIEIIHPILKKDGSKRKEFNAFRKNFNVLGRS